MMKKREFACWQHYEFSTQPVRLVYASKHRGLLLLAGPTMPAHLAIKCISVMLETTSLRGHLLASTSLTCVADALFVLAREGPAIAEKSLQHGWPYSPAVPLLDIATIGGALLQQLVPDSQRVCAAWLGIGQYTSSSCTCSCAKVQCLEVPRQRHLETQRVHRGNGCRR